MLLKVERKRSHVTFFAGDYNMPFFWIIHSILIAGDRKVFEGQIIRV